jgi:predicted transcriptional regulator
MFLSIIDNKHNKSQLLCQRLLTKVIKTNAFQECKMKESPLKRYMKKNRHTARSLSREAGISYQTVINLLGGRDVKGSILKKISIATDGIVTMGDMVDDQHMEKKSD